MLYERGEGVQKDLAQAEGWLQRAADQGMQPASNELVRLNPRRPKADKADLTSMLEVVLGPSQ